MNKTLFVCPRGTPDYSQLVQRASRGDFAGMHVIDADKFVLYPEILRRFEVLGPTVVTHATKSTDRLMRANNSCIVLDDERRKST